MKKPSLPQKPIEPKENTVVTSINVTKYCVDGEYEISQILQEGIDYYGGYEVEGDWFLKSVSCEKYDDETDLTFIFTGGTFNYKNPNYEREMAQYRKKLSKYENDTSDYEGKLKTWQELNKEYSEKRKEREARNLLLKQKRLQKELTAIEKKLKQNS